MMRTSGLFILLFAFVMMASACNKEDEPTPNNNGNNNGGGNNNNSAPTENKLTAKTDGTDWEADSNTVTCILVEMAGTKSLTLTGIASDGSSITLSLSLWDGNTGTFNTSIVTLTNYVGMVYDDGVSESYSTPNAEDASATGTLSIDYWDEESVSGTFSFKGAQDDSDNTVTITEGTFSCTTVN